MQDKPLQKLTVCPGGQQLVEWAWQLSPLSTWHCIQTSTGTVRRGVQTAVSIKYLIVCR